MSREKRKGIEELKSTLALFGGRSSVETALPYRRLFAEEELAEVQAVFEHRWREEKDFGYRGVFEKRYTEAFSEFLGGGYTDAVSTGTSAMLIALAALDLPKASEVLLSPVTDPGGVTPAIFLGHKIRVADSLPGSHHVGAKELEAALSSETSVAVLVHIAGVPLDLDPIVELLRARNIKIIEDCSHAHGATYKGRHVGTFGDISFFSTMFSKNHASGGCGGLVFTKNEKFYHRVLAISDRGKPTWREDYQAKNRKTFLFPGLNTHQDEISSAIGYSTLRKLPDTIKRRTEIVRKINEGLDACACFSTLQAPKNTSSSPFFLQIALKDSIEPHTCKTIKEAVKAEGIPISPRYDYVVSEWPWMTPYLPKDSSTPNASRFSDRSFNILFHERFSDQNTTEILQGLKKVDQYFQGNV